MAYRVNASDLAQVCIRVLQDYPVINTNKTEVSYLVEGNPSLVGVSLRYSMIKYVADADAAVRYICISLGLYL